MFDKSKGRWGVTQANPPQVTAQITRLSFARDRAQTLKTSNAKICLGLVCGVCGERSFEKLLGHYAANTVCSDRRTRRVSSHTFAMYFSINIHFRRIVTTVKCKENTKPRSEHRTKHGSLVVAGSRRDSSATAGRASREYSHGRRKICFPSFRLNERVVRDFH